MKFAHFSHIWAKPGMTPHERYEVLWRELQLCDALSFDHSFCVEHHSRPDESWMSSPSLYAVGAGARSFRRFGGRRLHPLLLSWLEVRQRRSTRRTAGRAGGAELRMEDGSICHNKIIFQGGDLRCRLGAIGMCVEQF
jgi:hypothetical protein